MIEKFIDTIILETDFIEVYHQPWTQLKNGNQVTEFIFHHNIKKH